MKNLKIIPMMLIVSANLNFCFGQNMKQGVQNKMAAFHWLTGNWKGSGWYKGKDIQQLTFQQSEAIELIQDSTVIVIKGLGKSGTKVVHQAFAVLYWDLHSETYKFLAFTDDGRQTLTNAIIDENGKLIWKIETQKGSFMVYTISENEDGNWIETGEMETVGNERFQFMEMVLKRQ